MNSPHKQTHRNTQHSTWTGTAKLAAKALRRAGFLPHAGFITANRNRSAPRASVTVENYRIRINVSGEAHQEVFVYGSADSKAIVNALRKEFQIVTLRSVVVLQRDSFDKKVETESALPKI